MHGLNFAESARVIFADRCTAPYSCSSFASSNLIYVRPVLGWFLHANPCKMTVLLARLKICGESNRGEDLKTCVTPKFIYQVLFMFWYFFLAQILNAEGNTCRLLKLGTYGSESLVYFMFLCLHWLNNSMKLCIRLGARFSLGSVYFKILCKRCLFILIFTGLWVLKFDRRYFDSRCMPKGGRNKSGSFSKTTGT